MQEVVPSNQKQSGAQVKEAREETDASDDEWKAKLNKLTQKFPSARCRQLGLWSDNNSWLFRVKRVSWADGASRLVGEPGTVSGVLGSDTLVKVKPVRCHANEGPSHDLELENSTCVADVPNLDDSVVRDCDDSQSCTDDAIPASCTPGSALGVGNTGQTFFCLPEDIRLGTKPVCSPLPFLAPNVGSDSIVDCAFQGLVALLLREILPHGPVQRKILG